VLLPVALSANDLDLQSAATEGLIALGPEGAHAVRTALAKQTLPLLTFNRLLAALCAMARQDAFQELKALWESVDAGREDEATAIGRALGRYAPKGLADLFLLRWNETSASIQLEMVRAFRMRDDLSGTFCDRALSSPNVEVRKVAFEMALRTPAV